MVDKKRTDKCSTCPYFFNPSNEEIDSPGWCDLVDDYTAITYWNWKCMWAENYTLKYIDPTVVTGPPKAMVEATIEKKRKFQESLDRAKSEIETWPEWKQSAVRAAIQIPKQPDYEVNKNAIY